MTVPAGKWLYPALLAALAAGGPASAQTGPAPSAAPNLAQGAPWLWAAPALYGLERSACDRGRAAAPGAAANAALRDTAMIAPLFCDQFTPERRAAIGAAFSQSVARHFPQVEPVLGQHLPVDAAAPARLRGTLAVSLRLTRATFTAVDKRSGVDAFLPVTLTLDVTNVATGEVVFTRSRSAVAEGTYPADRANAELARQLPAHLAATMEALVSESAAAFRPYAQSATVIGDVSLGKPGKGWVVDRGRAAGLRTGDSIGADGQVLYAGPDYAVVQPVLGEYRTGQVLARTVLAPAETLARPGVLTVVDAVPDGYAAPYVGQVFEDAMGAAGGLAPIPVNPAFAPLRALALSSAQADMGTDARSLPDYVASLRVVLLDPATYPSNLPAVEIDHFEAHAFVTLVDATGRVVGAWHGLNVIDDKVNAGVRFDPAQRRDAVLRNALIDAAKKMAAFRPQPQFLPVSGRGGAFVIADPAGAVPVGLTLPVLRPAGRFKGLGGAVMVPAGELTAQEPGQGTIAAADAGVTPLALQGGEVVALETAGTPATTRRAVAQCLDAAGLPRAENRGAVPVPFWPVAAENLLAQRMAAPIRLATLPARLRAFAPSFAGWDRFGAARERAPDSCFVPIIAADAVPGGYGVAAGFALYRGAEKFGSSGLKVTLRPTALPPAATAESVAAMLQSDLAAQAPPLALSAAASLKPVP